MLQLGADFKSDAIDLEVLTPQDPPDITVVETPVKTKQCRPHRWIWNNRRILTCVLAPLILIPIPLAHPTPVSTETTHKINFYKNQSC